MSWSWSQVWLTIILLSSALHTVTSQSCRMSDFEVQSDFDLDRFMGTWYELSWVPANWFPPEYNYQDYEVTYTRYTPTYVKSENVGRNVQTDTCVYQVTSLFTTDTPGKLLYERPLNETSRMTSDYWVMTTDYESYALVFGCRERDDEDRCIAQDGWVWSRTTSLSSEEWDIMNAGIQEVCMETSQFMETLHSKQCPANKGSVRIVDLLLVFSCLYAIYRTTP